jgi:hypothetical protein
MNYAAVKLIGGYAAASVAAIAAVYMLICALGSHATLAFYSNVFG